MFEKLSWYWRNFVQNKERGMNMKEWIVGSSIENGEEMQQEGGPEMFMGYFKKLDTDNSGTLSYDEFMALLEDGEDMEKEGDRLLLL